MRGWWQDLTDLVLPAECGGCGRPRTVLCPECRAALNGVAPRRVRPVPEPPGLPAVYAAARYADAVRAVLLAHKERGALALAGPLGSALAGAVWAGVREVCEPEGGGSASGCAPGPWERGYVGGEGQVREASASSTEARDAEAVTRGRGDWPGSDARGRGGDRQVGAEGVAYGSYVRSGAEVLTGGGDAEPGWGAGGAWRRGGLGVPVLLVPVPSARRAVRARGHDPARRIALAAAAELRRAGMPTRVAAVLRQRRGVADQSGLNSRQRLENLSGALTVVPGGERLLAQGLVVLVDDLMTTGASLTEAARAVWEARRRDNAERRGEQARHRGEQTAVGPRDQRRRGMAGRPGQEQRGTAGGHGGWRSGREVDGSGGEGAGVVYTAATREGMGERMVTVTEEDMRRERRSTAASGTGGVRDAICAAVVAASPDACEINRN